MDDWAEQDFKIKRQVQPASPGVDNNLQALQNRFAYLNNTTGVGPKDAGAHNETGQVINKYWNFGRISLLNGE